MTFAELGHFTIDDGSVRLLGESFCRKNRVVVLDLVDPKSREPVKIGTIEPDNEALLERIARTLERPIKAIRLNAYEIDKALDAGFGVASVIEALRPRLTPTPQLSFDPSIPAIQVLNEVLAYAVSKRASDVHIEAHDDDVDIRVRVDGALQQVSSPIGASDLRRVIARLKVLAGLDIAETRVPQDGRILATYDDGGGERPIDFRVSIVPGPFGEDAVLRLLDASRQLVDLPLLGFAPAHLAQVTELINSPEGLFFVTGPTGSGKTTTLYSILRMIAGEELKVLTAEDPIEYRFAKISQKQVTSKLGFADYARAFLRQDPDVLLIGEVRDEDTAEIAVRAAQTGHLVFSTLHTNDSVSTLRRLSTLGIEAENISSSLLAILAQRLVRKLCPVCKTPASPDRGSMAGVRGFDALGCASCDRGYRGRTGLFELFVPDEELAEMIACEETVVAIRARARQKGMRVLVEDGSDKVDAGVTSFAELKRSISHRLFGELNPGGAA